MYTLLEKVSQEDRVLDLGAGPGSFPYARFPFIVAAVDNDAANFGAADASGRVARVRAAGPALPFRDNSFALVICHHSLEHFADVSGTLDEISRVLGKDGALYLSVPDGAGFTDRMYRFLLAGGGHVNRFLRDSLVAEVERRTRTHLVRWTKLYTSFNFIARRHYVLRPRGLAVPPVPRRIRWLGLVPEPVFDAARLLLNVGVRRIDQLLGTEHSIYGWALVFGREPAVPRESPGFLNVCSRCGAGHPDSTLSVAWLFYRCPACGTRNPYFKPIRGTL